MKRVEEKKIGENFRRKILNKIKKKNFAKKRSISLFLISFFSSIKGQIRRICPVLFRGLFSIAHFSQISFSNF